MAFFSRVSLANKSIIAIATVAILLLGVFIIPSLKQELFPSVTPPSITIVTPYPGASPAQVERDVTNPLEQNIQGLKGIQQYQSQSNQNVSIITVLYNFGTDLTTAQQTLQGQVNKTLPQLPANVTPQINTFSPTDQPIISLAISSAQNQQLLALDIKQMVVPALQGISGVNTVNVTGVRKPIVTITLNLTALHTDGISITQVQNVLQANNVSMPAGEVTSNGQTLAVSIDNSVNSLQDLENVVVGFRAPTSPKSAQSLAGPIKLSDVASVQQDLAASTSLTRTNGQPSLGVDIIKTSDGNLVTISQDLRSIVPDLQKKLGHDAQIVLVGDQAPYIQNALQSLAREGLLGAGFAILVILIFLFSIRSTLVTAVSIPLSVIIALIGMWTQGFSLNILTLTALTIAVGRVVDDSIVVLENIYRHLNEGEEKYSAVTHAVKEVAKAITASTLTTVAVFLPLAFLGGIAGAYTQPLALTVAIALLASLFVALTIVPVLAYWFLKTPTRKNQGLNGTQSRANVLERAYVPTIKWVIKHRAVTLLLALLVLAGAFSLIPFLPINALGSQGLNTFTFSQQLPATTSLAQTDHAAQQVEEVLSGVATIQMYQVTVGGDASTGSSNGTNIANFMVVVKPNNDITAVQQTVQNDLNKLSNIGTIAFTNQGGNVIDVTIQDANEQTLRQATQQVFNTLAHTPNTTGIQSDLANSVPLIDVHVDSAKALKFGLTPPQVGQALQLVYSGMTVTHVDLNGVQQDVDVKVNASANTIAQMQDILIPGPAGNVRLGDVATVTNVMGPTQIAHFNGTRTATITLTATGQNTGAITSDVQNRINKLALPGGATATLGSATSSQNQALTNLYITLLIAFPLLYVIMVATFRSLIQPLILLVAIPFAAVGALLLAAITHTAIGIPSLFGFLMLMGIVVTNAIVLIDLVNQYREKGLDARAAVIEGGRHRVRPILMTAIATIMALIPMALDLGGTGNPIISGSLAIVVIGGLTSSTFLTLLLVPTLYVIVEDIKGHFRKKPVATPVELPVEDITKVAVTAL